MSTKRLSEGPYLRRNTILFVNLPGFVPLPAHASLAISAKDCTILIADDELAAQNQLARASTIDGLVLNAPNLPLLDQFRKAFNGTAILVTDLPLERFSEAIEGREAALLSHIIANRSDDAWTINELRITLRKILGNDIFGIEKYLAPGASIHKVEIRGSADRKTANETVAAFVRGCKLGRKIEKNAYAIAEELLMNATTDAPRAAGRAIQRDPTTHEMLLEPGDVSQLNFAFDGRTIAIGVRDPFGLIIKEKYFSYLKKVLVRFDPAKLIDDKIEGAGLGLYKILYSSHSVICNLAPNHATEVIALIDTEFAVHDFAKFAKSIHFFTTSI